MRFLLIVFFALFIPLKTNAVELSVILGQGMDDTLIQSGDTSSAEVKGFAIGSKLSERFNYWKLNDLQWFGSGEYLELNGQYLDEPERLTIVAIKPALRWWFDDQSNINCPWYVEAAWGMAKWSQDHFEEIQTASEWQFATHVSVGIKLTDWDLSFRYNHFSNGYLDQPNPGLDFLSINTAYQF